MHQTEKRERDRGTERDLNVTVMEVLGYRNVATHKTRSLLPCRWGRPLPALDRSFLVTALEFSAEAPFMHEAGQASGLDFLVPYKRFTVLPWTSPTTCQRYPTIIVTAKDTL